MGVPVVRVTCTEAAQCQAPGVLLRPDLPRHEHQGLDSTAKHRLTGQTAQPCVGEHRLTRQTTLPCAREHRLKGQTTQPCHLNIVLHFKQHKPFARERRDTCQTTMQDAREYNCMR